MLGKIKLCIAWLFIACVSLKAGGADCYTYLRNNVFLKHFFTQPSGDLCITKSYRGATYSIYTNQILKIEKPGKRAYTIDLSSNNIYIAPTPRNKAHLLLIDDSYIHIMGSINCISISQDDYTCVPQWHFNRMYFNHCGIFMTDQESLYYAPASAYVPDSQMAIIGPGGRGKHTHLESYNATWNFSDEGPEALWLFVKRTAGKVPLPICSLSGLSKHAAHRSAHNKKSRRQWQIGLAGIMSGLVIACAAFRYYGSK